MRFFFLLFVASATFFSSCGDELVTGPVDDGSPLLVSFNDNAFGRTVISQGDTLVALGRHLDQITTFELLDANGNQEIPFSRLRPEEDFRFYFILPVFEEGVLSSYGDKTFRVSGPNGTAELTVFINEPSPPEPTFTTVLISDFDGNGVPNAQGDQWGCYGAIGDGAGVQTEDPLDGNYYRIRWDGNTDPTFVGCQATTFAEALPVTNGDTQEVTVDFTIRGTIGSIVEVILREGDEDQPFTALHTISSRDWTEVQIPIHEFGFGFNPDDQSRDINTGMIRKIQFGIRQSTGINPSIADVDNLGVTFMD